jgi:hypothetical protein
MTPYDPWNGFRGVIEPAEIISVGVIDPAEIYMTRFNFKSSFWAQNLFKKGISSKTVL